jgi:ABC-type antimicrobial peptide transport system permease subunit
MIRNYLTTAFRNFTRHLSYSFINIFGLAIGLTTAILIAIWVNDEIKVDTGYVDHDRIYQILYNSTFSDGHIETSESTAGPLAEAIMADIPEVESAGRWDDPTPRLLRHENKSLLLKGLWTDPSIMEIFSFKVVKGSTTDLLKDPNSFVITQQTADKFFPGQDAVGKTFKIDEKYDMTVAAVIEKTPSNASKHFDFLMPYDVYYKENEWMSHWGNFNDQTYIKVKRDADIENLNSKLKTIVKKNCPDCMHQPFAQQLTAKYLNNNYENGKASGGRIEYVRLFILTAVFILFIACINYMNLATARSAGRSKEVGVRKASGAKKGQLIGQFISESLIITSISIVFSLVLVQLLLPLFNEVMGRHIVVDFFNPIFLLAVTLLTILVSLIAGSYPAFFLSSFKAASVLKGQVQSTIAGGKLRKGLVIFQFGLSVILIVGSLVVFKQTQFIMTKNLGFNKDNIIVFDMHNGVTNNQQTFKNEALKTKGIESITFAGQNPFSVGAMTTDVKWPGKNDAERVPFKLIFTDRDFLTTMKMELKEGSDFTNDKADSTNYIINETAAARLGYTNAIGAQLDVWNSPSGKVIGVVKDFHNQSLHNKIEPLIIMNRPDNTWRGFVKIENGSFQQAIKGLQEVHKKFDPTYPFEYQFLDKNFEKQYTSELTIQKLSLAFTAIAIFISSLGLFGLAAFMAERRTKEIGIRKVMGASVQHLVVLLSSDFLKLLLIALGLALPVAIYLSNFWLKSYEYRIDFTWKFPLIASCILLITALVSVGYQAMKAAVSTPVESLRSE